MPRLAMSGAASAGAFGFNKLAQAINDAYFNLVSLLLPGNGTNGAQNNTFLDSSSNNFTITRNGNTTQGTFSPFSQTGWSSYFSSSSFTTNTALFNSGWGTSGASSLTATIDCWIYVNALGTTPSNVWWNPNIFAKGDNYMCFGVNSSGNIFFYHYDGSARTITSSSTISTNTWVYVAVTITGGTATLYINGTSVGSGTWYGIQSAGLTGAVTLGRSPNASGQYWNGYISNFRVSSVARTISTPTAAFTSDGNTSFLTFQSNRFIDTSSNAYALTVETGTPSVQAFSPFAPTAAYSAATNGGSGYFDGSGDYLSVASSTALQLSTGTSWALECWVYPTTTDSIFICKRNSSTEYQMAQITKQLAFYNGSTTYYSGLYVTLNAWNHVVWSWDGTTLRPYLNGVLGTTTTSFSLPASGTNEVVIAGRVGSEYTTGYISDARIVKGSAVYTGSSLTVPTAPLTAITNTSLLLNFKNAGIIDSTAKNVLETVGNAQISTTQSKWGGSSIYLDGAGDYAIARNNPAFLFGTGDFTVELWFYPNTLTGGQALVGMWGTGNISWLLYLSGGNLYWYTSTDGSTQTATMNGASGMSTGGWYHIALVRNSGTTRIYVNGSSVVSTTTSVNLFNATCPLTVGYNPVGGTPDYVNGYIDDLRITKGYARYTSSFTPPTAAFPVQ